MKQSNFTDCQIIAVFIQADERLKLGHQLPLLAQSGHIFHSHLILCLYSGHQTISKSSSRRKRSLSGTKNGALPTPDYMRKRFSNLDRMKYRENGQVIDIGGWPLRIMFLLILSGERSSSNTSAHTQSVTSSRTSTEERKNELCSSHQSGK